MFRRFFDRRCPSSPGGPISDASREAFAFAGAERLEDRQMLAGNVTVTLRGSDLIIRGDDLDNQVEITQQSGDLVWITGLSSAGQATTVNGLPRVELTIPRPSTQQQLSDHLQNLRVDLRGGNDFLRVTANTNEDMSLRGGAGTDIIDVDVSVILGDLTVDTGSADRNATEGIYLRDHSVGESTRIKGGSGSQNVGVVRGMHGGDVTIQLGRGAADGTPDVVSVASSRFEQDLTVTGGDGRQECIVQLTGVAGRFRCRLGSGNDRLVIDTSLFGEFRAHGGSGLDTFRGSGVFFSQLSSFEDLT